MPYTYEEVNGFRDTLTSQLVAVDLPFGVGIDSTLTGRWIIVTVEDLDDLPADFGVGVPSDVYAVEEGDVGFTR